ncbi:uncharacterized protein LOC114946545 [Nylanderia fulva]|uniref:uncharacterized protein LOC114946545 n=1 Tax=Nylanderia fulva TaxID=613905 RepID=UPI0010FB8903|nr:uncharacterized protein LOC114946545 [Nylanderia fulva]
MMKGCLVLLLMMLCVFAHAAQVSDGCPYEEETLTVGEHIRKCLRVTCHADGSISMLGCALYRCQEGKQIGYRETDLSKPYPECCEGPICKE